MREDRPNRFAALASHSAPSVLGPVRIRPACADDTTLTAANAGRARRFEPVDEARYGVQITRRPDIDDLKHWAAHPDERVALAAIDMLHQQRPPEGLASLVDALLARADRDGMVWTPTLSAARGLGWGAETQEAATLPPPTQRMETLAPWLGRATADDVLHLLAAYPEFGTVAARHARAFTYDVFELLVRDQSIALAENPHLTAAQEERLVSHCMRGSHGALSCALRARGAAVSPRVFAQEITKRGYNFHAYKTALELRLSEEQLLAMATPIDQSEGVGDMMLGNIACSPWATPAVWQAVFPRLRSSTAQRTADAIASRPAVRDDPVTRKMVIENAWWSGRICLMGYLTEEQRTALHAEMLTRPRYELLAWMKKFPEQLTAEVAAVLLEHKDREVRLAAMTLLPEAGIRAGDTPGPPPPARQR